MNDGGLAQWGPVVVIWAVRERKGPRCREVWNLGKEGKGQERRVRPRPITHRETFCGAAVHDVKRPQAQF